jgi:hypothetical protein
MPSGRLSYRVAMARPRGTKTACSLRTHRAEVIICRSLGVGIIYWAVYLGCLTAKVSHSRRFTANR